ncbi:MAG: hypothetical protein R2774_03640 [Saprospiraceae bacterium]
MQNNILLYLFVNVMIVTSTSVLAQKRCYTYDAAGCRVMRDQSCDETCSIIVTNTNDNGPGSLRKAIDCAESGDTILFAANVIGQTIQLTSGPIKINKDIYILQQSTTSVSIDGSAPVLQINSGATEIAHITLLAGCVPNLFGTGLLNYGTVYLKNITIIEDSNANCGEASVYNQGIMLIEGTTSILKQ